MSDTTSKPAWMLRSLLEIPEVLHAVLLSRDGLMQARTEEISKDEADTYAAAMSGLASLCQDPIFSGGAHNPWLETVIEFDSRYVFAVRAGAGAYLGVSTTAAVDLAAISRRMHELVGQIGHEMAVADRQGLGFHG
ncbi:roadblock/LC7 domain-containing protein [Streptomyces sp. Da 82-17]|uniref:roadblock/LC7 domain-containing protein n=1 Tax=Streptomyces sp. Da 82-17 TaxID=3377116 RepID=UPI0038D4AE37